MSLHGKSTISYDRNTIEKLWKPIVKIWMQGGVDNPNLSVIQVIPDDGYNWNNKNGKMVAFAKMATSLITGTTMDDGIEGNLEL